MKTEIGISLEILRQRQQELLREYERLLQQVKDMDAMQENESLRSELTEAKERFEALEKRYGKVAQENRQLRLSLQEQILDEKLNILKVSREKLQTYFAGAEKSFDNRLTAAEKQAMAEIDALKVKALNNLNDDLAAVATDLAGCAERVQEAVHRRREGFGAAMAKRAENYYQRLDELGAEAVSPEIIEKRIKQNEIEMKIGLNWVNKLGILLILFGVGAAAKYSFTAWLNAYMKGAMIFLLGGGLSAAGEWTWRKGKDIFAAGLLGGGVAVLYCGIFYSYFLLKIIGLYTGIGLSVLVTATAVALAVRYRSQTICALGLIGGYLPFFSYLLAFGFQGDTYYAAMGYLFLLNLSVMLVSFRQKWITVNYVSMLFHLPSLLYLVHGAVSAHVGILYATASFATYLGITLAYPLTYRQGLRRADVILLGINTMTSCTVLYGLFKTAGWSGYNGLLALGFCLIYAGLARLVDRKMPAEQYTRVLFYATAVTFAVLMVPFQFGVRWLSLGWLVEGIVLIIYGRKNNQDRLERSGWLLFGLCLVAFYLFDWCFGRNGHYFDLKYFAVITGMVAVTGVYLVDLKRGISLYGRYWEKIHWFKYFTIVNVWFYLIYLSSRLFDFVAPAGYQAYFYRHILVAAVTLAMAYILPRLPLVMDKVVYYFSLGQYGLAVLLCGYINLTIPVMKRLSDGDASEYCALAALVFYNLLVLLIVREVVPLVLKQHYLNLEIYPLAMLLVLLGNITAFLTTQFNLGSTNLAFSLIYLFAALAAIHYGFHRKYAYVRRVGLGLALLSTTKLFIFDLAFLTSFNQILAYFCFGFVLLGISYLYQRLKSGRGDNGHGKNM
ncbi:DUF2339 domain-containing protein [Acetonema longum]|uniref:Membrane protein-like protein n=1 Tax=Acetonema longum DSM 6540 TaxID=1009370 RepID=F7NJP4_9FIRM|nr:DUF2339 domain-containing protein [Acetonema longum]EGO63700.1 membrane protein-like protein [Acetonema longum DSM 6540]